MYALPHSMSSYPYLINEHLSSLWSLPVDPATNPDLDPSPKKKVKFSETQGGPSDANTNIEENNFNVTQPNIQSLTASLCDLRQAGQKSILDHYQNRLSNTRAYYDCNRFFNQASEPDMSQVIQTNLNFFEANTMNTLNDPNVQSNTNQYQTSQFAELAYPSFLSSESFDKDPLWGYLDEQHKDFEQFVDKINSIISICAIKLGSFPSPYRGSDEEPTSPLESEDDLLTRNSNLRQENQKVRSKRGKPKDRKDKKTKKSKGSSHKLRSSDRNV